MISPLFPSYPQPLMLLKIAAGTPWAVLGREETEVLPIRSDPPAYQTLATEQHRALSSQPDEKFQSLVDDFLAFRSAAAELFTLCYSDHFAPKDLATLTNALLDYGKGNSCLASRGSPVSHSFHGHWRGQWFQDGAVDIAESIEDGTVAPRWGIYIDDRTLIWIAQFGARDERPYYSLYFEQILEGEPIQSQIRRIGFHWAYSPSSALIAEPRWKKGRYWRAQDLEEEPGRVETTKKRAP